MPWTSTGGSLRGPTGPQGPQGPAGAAAAALPASRVNDWLAWTCDPLNAGTTPAITAGVIYLTRVALPTAQTISGAWFYNAASAAMNSLGYVGLYDADGVRRAVSANITTPWQSLGDKQVPFVTPYAAPAGDYWIAFLVNGTTTPKPSCAPGARANMGLTAGRLRCSSILTGQTTLPGNITMANMAAFGNLPAFGLY